MRLKRNTPLADKLERQRIRERRKVAAELKRASRPAAKFAIRGALFGGLGALTYFAVQDGLFSWWAAAGLWAVGAGYCVFLALAFQLGRAEQAVTPKGFDGFFAAWCYDAVRKSAAKKRRQGQAPRRGTNGLIEPTVIDPQGGGPNLK